MELDEFVNWMEALDEETHEHGGDTNCRGTSYDVDYVNPRRVLTGREAADLYEGLEEHDDLMLYRTVLEERTFEKVTLRDGRRLVPAGDSFTPGYNVFYREGGDLETALTFAEKQLPDTYTDMFKDFHESDENKERALEMGLGEISNLAGGGIEE